MATSSPFSLLEPFLRQWRPPAWLVDEGLNRCVLLINHVLASEPEAMARLARQKGQRIVCVWPQGRLALSPTPAGLFERIDTEAFDLQLTLTDPSPLDVVAALARGDKPRVHIQGDVQLAAEINWLIDNVRWDIEEDLARVLGDAPAQWLVGAARQAWPALRSFVVRRASATPSGVAP